MFDIGDKVVCVDSSMQTHTVAELVKDMPNWVKKGETYTIRGFVENDGIVLGVLLEEITNPIRYFRLIKKMQEPAFAEWRFKKQIKSKVEEKIEKEQLIEMLI